MREELKKHYRSTQRKNRIIETKVCEDEFKQDNTFNGFFSSLGFAIVVATLLVTVGKMVSQYYFLYTAAIFIILLVVLMGVDYHHSVSLHGWYAYIEHLIETKQHKITPIETNQGKVPHILPQYNDCRSMNFKRMTKSHWQVAKKIQKFSSSDKDLNKTDRLAVRKPKLREVIDNIKGKSPMLLRKRLTKSDCSDLSLIKRTREAPIGERERSTTAMTLPTLPDCQVNISLDTLSMESGINDVVLM